MKAEESKDTKLVEENNTNFKKEEKVSNLKETAVIGASAILGGAATAAAMKIMDKPVSPEHNDDPKPPSSPIGPEQETEIPSTPIQEQEEEQEVLPEPEPIVSNINEDDVMEVGLIEEEELVCGLVEPDIILGEEDIIIDGLIDGLPNDTGYINEQDILLTDINGIITDDLGDNIHQDLIDTIDLA